MVRCPICMDFTEWPSGEFVYLWSDDQERMARHDLVDLDQAKRTEHRLRGYQACENPHGAPSAPRHFLPALYAEYEEPLVVGLVGGSQAGKTHLLTAMIREVLRGGLAPYDLRAQPLDFRAHRFFYRDFLEKFEKGEQLAATGRDVNAGGFAESLLITGPDGTRRPIVFFDVAGEDLEQVDTTDRGGRFLVATGAVIFVYAPEDPLTQREIFAQIPAGRDLDDAYRLSLARITAAQDADQLPVTIAVTKADRLRYRPPADFWLRRGAETGLNAARIREESRDAYAYLHAVGAAVAVAPYAEFERCTLHFVSASGGDVQAERKEFSRGVRPLRVLEPLVSILAMAGVLTGPEAQKVGRP